MIIQSPESAMPEPYKTYVRQRSETIAKVLADIVGDHNVQLCPRAISPEEQVFLDPADITYGAVVKTESDGLKSVLYEESFRRKKLGIVARTRVQARDYAATQFNQGNRVRIKDATESDGKGQVIADNIDALDEAVADLRSADSCKAVIMPHLVDIKHRISVGHIALGKAGCFGYVGQEESQLHEGADVYAGTTLGLFRRDSTSKYALALQQLDIPPYLAQLGQEALQDYQSVALSGQRVSVDVIEGITDNGSTVRDVIDLTPRVGGTTPAEVLAMREIYAMHDGLCFARSQLIYDPDQSPTTGTNFIDTDSLVINAEVLGVQS